MLTNVFNSTKSYTGVLVDKKGLIYIKQSKLFPCYSIPMRDFFTSKGIKYELVGLHPKSYDMFWVYIKTIELEKAMNEWSSNNR